MVHNGPVVVTKLELYIPHISIYIIKKIWVTTKIYVLKELTPKIVDKLVKLFKLYKTQIVAKKIKITITPNENILYKPPINTKKHPYGSKKIKYIQI